MRMFHSDPCEKRGSKLINKEFIRRHVYGLLEKNREPKDGHGYLNTLSVVKGSHKTWNNKHEPCSNCIFVYSKWINEYVKLYKNK